MSFTLHATHPVAENPLFSASLDEYRDDVSGAQMLFAHIRFDRWSKTALKRLLHEWRLLRACVSSPIFAYPETDDSKWERFVRLLGFSYLYDLACTDGHTRRVFISLPQQRIKNASEDYSAAATDFNGVS